ncbi:MAG TPA: hypothetical protein VG847_02435 [Chitinophagaceae bacterium]|nr:hypothetical protein [Chitinophagaceae bacterium]
MNAPKKERDITEKIQKALDKAIQKLIAEEKARDGYLYISDKKGGVLKIRARDL